MVEYNGRKRGLLKIFLEKGWQIFCSGIFFIVFVDVVIIDEIFMIDDLLMEVLDCVGRFWWIDQKYFFFGGLRMVFVGDFQQLLFVGSGMR